MMSDIALAGFVGQDLQMRRSQTGQKAKLRATLQAAKQTQAKQLAGRVVELSRQQIDEIARIPITMPCEHQILVPMLQCSNTGLRVAANMTSSSYTIPRGKALIASVGFTRQLEYLIATNVNYKDDKPDSFLLGGNFVQLYVPEDDDDNFYVDAICNHVDNSVAPWTPPYVAPYVAPYVDNSGDWGDNYVDDGYGEASGWSAPYVAPYVDNYVEDEAMNAMYAGACPTCYAIGTTLPNGHTVTASDL